MNFTRTTASLLLLAAFGFNAHAQVTKTREQVKTELAEAIRTGDMLANGESGLKLNELNPQRYPKPPLTAVSTREQVKAELAEAIRTGNMLAGGEIGLNLNEEFPQRYPAVVAVAEKTRGQVKSETAQAIRSGDMLAGDETGLKLNQEYPRRYAKERGNYTAQAQWPSPSASANSAVR
jgi:hypothetical protein